MTDREDSERFRAAKAAFSCWFPSNTDYCGFKVDVLNDLKANLYLDVQPDVHGNHDGDTFYTELPGHKYRVTFSWRPLTDTVKNDFYATLRPGTPNEFKEAKFAFFQDHNPPRGQMYLVFGSLYASDKHNTYEGQDLQKKIKKANNELKQQEAKAKKAAKRLPSTKK